MLESRDMMDSINYIRDYLYNNDLKMAVIRDKKVIATSKDRGIKPIFDVYTMNHSLLKDSYVADRVIGKAAAIFLIHGKIKGLYTDLISDVAMDVLEEAGIEVEYKKKVPFILNREGNDLCPIESIARKSDNINDLISGIEEFFIKVGMIKNEK